MPLARAALKNQSACADTDSGPRDVAASGSEGNAPEASVVAQVDMQILVVDDFSTMRRIIKGLLHDLGFANITEADDGLTALPLLKAGHFDLLITDWNMPGMPGLDLLKAVRSDPKLAKIPVLMLTAEAKRDADSANAEAERDCSPKSPT